MNMKVILVDAMGRKRGISWETFSRMQKEKIEKTKEEYVNIYYFTVKKVDLEKQELWVSESQYYYHA